MTDTGERSGGSWWPTIVLWGAVIAVGALYLLSVERHRQDAPGDVAQAQHAAAYPGAAATTAEAPVVEVPVVDAVAVEVVEVVEVDVVPLIGVTGVPASDLGAPSAQVADHASEGQVAAPTSIPKVTSPEEAPVVAPAVAPVAEAKVLAAQVSPLEARAIAGAVTETVPADQTQAVAESGSAPDQAQGAAAQERARILAEYEAIRRAAQADLERRSSTGRPWPPNSWSQGQAPWYPNPSYGPPGAGQRYAPNQPRW